MPLNYYYAMMSTFSYRIIAVSGAVRDELQTYIGNNDRIHVIHNSVDIPRHGSFPQWNDNIVLAAGGICPRKGYIHYIHAAAFVKKEFPKVEFRIAGSVWHRQYYKQLVQAVYDLGLQENVSFFGRTEDMATLYKSATICVIPSEAEPFSLVAIEAMARGLPVVATRSGGPQEIVRHEETGYLVPTGDPEEMAERIITLLTNRDLAKRMGDAGKERAKIKFNPEQQLAAFIEVLKEC
jgi:glycosyltransferase involved in cell wall biosynthesis